jgi:hypothetical protein
VTNQNLIQEKIKRRLNSGNARYHSVHNLLSPRLLSKNVKITIQNTIILSVVLHGCETRPLTFKEEQRRRALEKMVLRRIFGPSKGEVMSSWRKLHNLYPMPNLITIIK